MLTDLLGLDRLTNSFGMVIVSRGIASLLGTPIAGSSFFTENSLSSRSWSSLVPSGHSRNMAFLGISVALSGSGTRGRVRVIWSDRAGHSFVLCWTFLLQKLSPLQRSMLAFLQGRAVVKYCLGELFVIGMAKQRLLPSIAGVPRKWKIHIVTESGSLRDTNRRLFSPLLQ